MMNRDKWKEYKVCMVASAFEITCLLPFTYPLDTIKSRMQAGYYNSYNDIFKHSEKKLYSGYFVLYGGLLLKQPLKMAVFEQFENHTIGSITAALIGLTVGIPLSYIKTNYQIYNKLSKNKNIYTAWNYEMTKEMSGNIIFLTTYGYLRRHNDYYGTHNIDKLNFLFGAISSLLTTTVIYPLDMFKTRKQTVQINENFNTIFTSIVKENNKINILNLWKGIMPMYLRLSLFSGIGMSMYEKAKNEMLKYF